ncbi:hypothetical protein [Leadbettera azotonutricia]|nr:hypothetical protein [Leadbettera azotonutricia]
MDGLGAAWVRTTLRWTSVEREPGKWDYSYWDEYIDNGKTAGKKIMISLGFDNGYLYDDRKEHRDLTERELPYFLEYVERTVLRYKGRVDAWEIWNEPNLTFWKGSDEHFIALAKAAAQRIRDIDPEAKIVSAAFWRTPKRYIRGMFEAGAMEHVDAVSFHPYAASPGYTLRLYEKLAAILADYNYRGGIWVTEVGYPTHGWYPTRVSEDKYPAYIVKTIAGLAVRGVNPIIWYELFDEYNKKKAPSNFDSENFFGIVYPDFSYKKGAFAYKLCSEYLSNTTYMPSAPERKDISKSVTSLFFRGEGRNALILWNTGIKRTVHLAIPDAMPIMHDIASDKEEMLTDDTIKLGRTPVFITWEGNFQPFELY